MGLSSAFLCFSFVLFVFSFTFSLRVKWRFLLFLLFTSVLNLPFIESFTLTSSLSLNVFSVVFFFFLFFSGEFKAALYGRISLLKCDKEWLWIPEFLFLSSLVPIFYCFWAFSGRELARLSGTLERFHPVRTNLRSFRLSQGAEQRERKRKGGNKKGEGVVKSRCIREEKVH